MYGEGLWASKFRIHEYLIPNLDKWLFFVGAGINQVADTPMLNASVQWSLMYEWLFYLSIPAIAFFWLKLGLKTWVIFIAVVLSLWLRCSPVESPGITLYTLFRLIFRNQLERAVSEWQVLMLMILSTLAVIAVSSLVHFVIERPSMKLVGKIYGIDRTQELAAP